jgi:hypothetical protein
MKPLAPGDVREHLARGWRSRRVRDDSGFLERLGRLCSRFVSDIAGIGDCVENPVGKEMSAVMGMHGIRKRFGRRACR